MLCAELYSAAAKINSQIDFAGLRIYGLLTDAVKFSFYSYDPKTQKFSFDEEILIFNKRPGSLVEMIDGTYFSSWQSPGADALSAVSNKIFGLVLSAYMEALRATIKKSKGRAKSNDVSPPVLHCIILLLGL